MCRNINFGNNLSYLKFLPNKWHFKLISAVIKIKIKQVNEKK